MTARHNPGSGKTTCTGNAEDEGSDTVGAILRDPRLVAMGKAADLVGALSGGHHCGICRQLDYLPIHCVCGLSHCHQCDAAHTARCPAAAEAKVADARNRSRDVPPCPVCSKKLKAPKCADIENDKAWWEAIDHMVGEHIDSGCKAHLRKVKISRTCAAKGCKDKMVAVAVTCEDCAKVFCVRHRAAAAHKCAGVSCATQARREASTPWARAAAERAAAGQSHALAR